MSDQSRGPASLEDLFAIAADQRFHELIAGELIRKATPTAE